MDGFCSDWCKEKAKTKELNTFKEGVLSRLTALEGVFSRLAVFENTVSRLTVLEDKISYLALEKLVQKLNEKSSN